MPSKSKLICTKPPSTSTCSLAPFITCPASNLPGSWGEPQLRLLDGVIAWDAVIMWPLAGERVSINHSFGGKINPGIPVWHLCSKPLPLCWLRCVCNTTGELSDRFCTQLQTSAFLFPFPKDPPGYSTSALSQGYLFSFVTSQSSQPGAGSRSAGALAPSRGLCRVRQPPKRSETVEGWLPIPRAPTPGLMELPSSSPPPPQSHFQSLALTAALGGRCNKRGNKTDHGKPGDKGTKHFKLSRWQKGV